MHHGIKNMKHGVRRYQNEDGTLTELGRERYGVGAEKVSSQIKDKKVTATIKDTEKNTITISDSKKAGNKPEEEKKVKKDVTKKAAEDKKTSDDKKKKKSAKKNASTKGASGKASKAKPHSSKVSKSNLSKYDASKSIMNKIHSMLASYNNQ